MTEFRVSSFCNFGDCVEVAVQPSGSAVMRDSKDAAGSPISFSADEWSLFVNVLKDGSDREYS